MASPSTSNSVAASSRPFLLPEIPELFNGDFLDVLIPPSTTRDAMLVDRDSQAPAPRNPMMDALKATANQTYTANMAPAYSSTLSPTLDAFKGISRYTFANEMGTYLDSAWKEDPDLTLRIIWNLRSIHDGKGEKEAFYRAFGWLYDNHPRTAILNLRLLVEPVVAPSKKKGKSATAHGYWKDLLNILALATVDELSGLTRTSDFLHTPRMPFTYGRNKNKFKTGNPASRIAASYAADNRAKVAAEAKRKAKQEENHQRLVRKLSEPKFRALFVAVARLFADQLIKDVKVLDELKNLKTGDDHMALLKTITLAGKWAPTPDGSHDRVTNIATAISELIYASQAFQLPSALNAPLPARDRAALLRSFYQRWILTELRKASFCPEPLMSANRWTEIKYNRVPSICMKNNTEHFFRHDPVGFEEYLTSVESNKKSMSGATLLPHELVAQVMKLGEARARTDFDTKKGKPEGMAEFKKRLAETQLRVVEAQWKTLINNLRESGSIENSVAVCDVSGSMGYVNYASSDKNDVSPILPAISLSLVLASLAKPPFDGGFITFSESPQYLQVDRTQSLYDQVMGMSQANWSMNTNLQSVFVDLLLPLAIHHNVKQEDMIKRLFIFSDMQFDYAQPTRGRVGSWETNYDVIERKYKEAGYEVPQIVYWDLSAGTPTTVETASNRKGVAMMNGFSSSMLKVFMGEQEEEEAKKEEMEWESVAEDGETATVVEKEEEEDVFNPVNVMKKALGRRSFDGLVVVD